MAEDAQRRVAAIMSHLAPRPMAALQAIAGSNGDAAVAAAAGASPAVPGTRGQSVPSRSSGAGTATAPASSLAERLRARRSVKSVSLRERSRCVGMSGNHWFAFELSSNLKPGRIMRGVWWHTPIALWRSKSGHVAAFQDVCPACSASLSAKSRVAAERLVCACGAVYDSQGFPIPRANEIGRVRAYPVAHKYSFIFLFPGDPALASTSAMPTIPTLDRDVPTPWRPVDITIDCHWSMIVENNCDFYHAYLHRKFKPFRWPELQWVQREGDAIHVHYYTEMGTGERTNWMLSSDLKPVKGNLHPMHLWFDYPLQRSNLADKYFHWCFFLPIDEHTTRTFYVFQWEEIEVGPISLPKHPWFRHPLLYGIHKLYLEPLLGQDRTALNEEQAAHQHHADKHAVELNPLVSAFQKLSIEKWDAYLISEQQRRSPLQCDDWRVVGGAGVDYALTQGPKAALPSKLVADGYGGTQA